MVQQGKAPATNSDNLGSVSPQGARLDGRELPPVLSPDVLGMRVPHLHTVLKMNSKSWDYRSVPPDLPYKAFESS